jgi:hypothetical protein
MGITFSKKSNRRRIVEPLFNRSRQKYRASRVSSSEILEMNSLILDLERITIELDEIDASVLAQSYALSGNIKSISLADKLNDGPDYDIDGIEINIDDPSTSYGSSIQNLSIKNNNILSARLSRIENKIKRLENGL